jgi:hypothetical protein
MPATLFWLLSVTLSLWLISLFEPPTCFFGIHFYRKQTEVTTIGDVKRYSHTRVCSLCSTVKYEGLVAIRDGQPVFIIRTESRFQRWRGKILHPAEDNRTSGLEEGKKRVLEGGLD